MAWVRMMFGIRLVCTALGLCCVLCIVWDLIFLVVGIICLLGCITVDLGFCGAFGFGFGVRCMGLLVLRLWFGVWILGFGVYSGLGCLI